MTCSLVTSFFIGHLFIVLVFVYSQTYPKIVWNNSVVITEICQTHLSGLENNIIGCLTWNRKPSKATLLDYTQVERKFLKTLSLWIQQVKFLSEKHVRLAEKAIFLSKYSIEEIYAWNCIAIYFYAAEVNLNGLLMIAAISIFSIIIYLTYLWLNFKQTLQ